MRPVNWTYAIGEVLLIVIGVSIALGVNAWYEHRLDRINEREYLCRLYKDISDDINRFDGFATRLEKKAETLKDLLLETDESLMARSLTALADDLARSDTVSLTAIQTVTFDDLRSTGRLVLLRNANVRAALADYYRRYELMSQIFAESHGPYKRILAGAIPGQAEFDRRINGKPIERTALLRGLQNLRSHSEFEPAVNAELSYTAGLLDWTRNFQTDAKELAKLLGGDIVGEQDDSDLAIECFVE